jgi:hypothetical protein
MVSLPNETSVYLILLLLPKWLERRLQSWHLTGESWHWDGLRTSGSLLPTIEEQMAD